MIKNYLVTAVRHLLKHKTFSLINITGLAIGLASCLIIAVYVLDELRYDSFHPAPDRTYRISRQWFNKNGETSLHLGHLAPSFAPLLKAEFPEMIQHIARTVDDNPLLVAGDKKFTERRFFYAEAPVFEMFHWPLIQGTTASFAEPNTVILTEDAARRYFGAENPVGQLIRNETEQVDLKVIGVARNLPGNTHFKWDFLCSFSTFERLVGPDYFANNFGNNSYSTFVMLSPGVSAAQLEGLLPGFIDRNVIIKNLPADVKISKLTKLNLWPIESIHLHSHLDSEIEANSDVKLVYIYTAIAGFILLIAGINFINLSTARAADRSKEVGVRKVVGADRVILIRQFIGEAIMVIAVALVVAVGLVELALPWFNSLAGKSLELSLFGDWQLFVVGFGIAALVGVGAGSYPAFYLSSFKPVEVLKGVLRTNRREIWFRGTLVVFQFAISIALIVCVVMIQRQLNFMQEKSLGFDKNSLAVLPVSNEMKQQLVSIKNRLLANPAIQGVTFSSRVPSGRLLDSQGSTAEIDGDMKQLQVRIADIHVDHDFMKTYRIPFAAGRDFDISLAGDSTQSFILNEAAVAAIGWRSAGDAIGKKFNYGNRNGFVIGVVKDFHFESLHQTIAPIVFLIPTNRIGVMSVRLSDEAQKAGLQFLGEQWNGWRPNFPFEYTFVDENFRVQYRSEEKLGEIVGYFAGLAILVALLGLFALATFSAQKRTKEIGIRKVLGAAVPRLVLMLCRDFTKFVVIANIIAWPAAYWACQRWLDLFPYRIEIGPMPFVLAGVTALAVALLTVGYHAFRSASSNPVTALKYE